MAPTTGPRHMTPSPPEIRPPGSSSHPARGLSPDALRRLATIVRGADTARPDIAPESAGLLAVSLGLSRLYSDDLEQLDADLGLYDAFYRWARDAVDEAHCHAALKYKNLDSYISIA
jgi:Chromate resistance exported protein